MNQEDTQFIKDARKDPNAYEKLYTKYSDKIYNYLWYRVGHDKDIAEDLMQEVFVRAYEHLPKFQIRGYSYLTYLYTIAHNVLVNYYKKPKAISLDAVGDVPYEVWGDIEEYDDAKLLWRTIQQLPQKDKDMLYMKYRGGLKGKEIAQISGKSENAVKLSLSRSRKKLANHPYLQDINQFRDQKRKQTKPRYKRKKK